MQGGQAKKLADLKVGDTVTVVYTFIPENNRVASSITIVRAGLPAAPYRWRCTDQFHLEHHGSAHPTKALLLGSTRPATLPRTVRRLCLAWTAGARQRYSAEADQAGFLVVSCSFSGNSAAGGWVNDDPRICGYEDYDYLTEVINRVRNGRERRRCLCRGISKGGHTSLAYACERPDMIRAAASVDEFMGLTSNRPTAPVPVIVFQGTSDRNVPYTKVKDTVDAWRPVDGLMNTAPVTTYESAPRARERQPSDVAGGIGGTQVAFVTIVGGGHVYPRPDIQTGYDYTEDLWAFFSQFLTDPPARPTIVSQPADNIQPVGQPASFRVTAAGGGTLAFQWQRNGEDIPGATQSWLTIPAVTPADNSVTFRAVVSDAVGSVTSTVVALTVIAPPTGPTITVQPKGLTVAAGQPAAFSVEATGAPPLRYQWRRNGVNIPGATDASYTVPIAVPFDSGATFSVLVANGAGKTASTPATLTVTRPPGSPVILANPDRLRLLVGQPGAFSVAAWSATPLRYQWQRRTQTGLITDIPGATEATYTISDAKLTERPILIRCLVSNAAGSVASASEMLFVTAEPKSPSEITSDIRVVAQAAVPFTYTIASSGGALPLTYSAEPLPPGLSLDPVSGRITGTPTQVGNTRVVIGAANSAGRVSAILDLAVTTTPPPISIESWRFAHFGASARDLAIAGDAADPDGDGRSNIEEFRRKSDPLNKE